MLDIRLIREKPDFVRERLATRGGETKPELMTYYAWTSNAGKTTLRFSN